MKGEEPPMFKYVVGTSENAVRDLVSVRDTVTEETEETQRFHKIEI